MICRKNNYPLYGNSACHYILIMFSVVQAEIIEALKIEAKSVKLEAEKHLNRLQKGRVISHFLSRADN